MNRLFLILLFAAALVARAAPAERIAGVIPDVARPLPAALVLDKQKVTVRFEATGGNEIGAVFGVRTIRANALR
jgi:hypothetical protein